MDHVIPSGWRARASLAKACGLVLVAALGAGDARAGADVQEASRAEYRLKAAFLYNFAKYVDWPASAFDDPGDAFRLCIFGARAYAVSRETLAGKKVKGRKLELRSPAGAGDAASCHMVFVSAEADVPLQSMLSSLREPVLMVGEAADFLHSGGAINLLRLDNKVRFEIRQDRADGSTGLQFSSQLLKLAVLSRPD